MSARDELARVLHGWGESHDWRSERCDEFCAAWLEAADAVLSEWLPTAFRDGSLDESVGAEGEADEPLDMEVRNLASLAYLVVTCEALGIEPDEEWDAFMFARAIHRRVHSTPSPTSPPPVPHRVAGEHVDRPGAVGSATGRSASTT